MDHKTTADEVLLFNDITTVAGSLWDKSEGISGRNDDPKMFSIMLFKRLWSNHRGFALLWRDKLQTECAILLRSGVEAAICLAANYKIRDDFVALMLGDAIYTLKAQIKMYREDGSDDMVRDCEATLRQLQSRFPSGRKAARLQWEELSRLGEVAHLYGWHRFLSGVSSHVTGFSILPGVVPLDGAPASRLLTPLQLRMNLMMMAGATLEGMKRHAEMIGGVPELRACEGLTDRLFVLSWGWPGVTTPTEEARL